MRLMPTIERISGSRRSQRGLSLFEIVATTAVATIIFGVSMPSMQTVLNKYALKAAANEVANSIEYARSRAILKNKPMTFSISNRQFGVTGTDTGGFRTQTLSSDITMTPTTAVSLTLKSNGTIAPQTTLTFKNSKNMSVTLTIYSSGKAKVSDVTGP